MKAVLVTSLILASFVFAQSTSGGWNKANAKDPQVLEAARFAVKDAQSRTRTATLQLISVEFAEQQVVAGMNY
jgi:N-acyl-L-homoserine lactone synthetase